MERVSAYGEPRMREVWQHIQDLKKIQEQSMSKYRGDGSKANELELLPKTFEPIGNLVILQPVTVSKSPGGVVLPDGTQERGGTLEPPQGWVVAAGCQCRYVRRGDLVIMAAGSWTHFKHAGNRLVYVSETQLMGIERDDKNEMPVFKVLDWKDGIVGRLPDVPAGIKGEWTEEELEALRAK